VRFVMVPKVGMTLLGPLPPSYDDPSHGTTSLRRCLRGTKSGRLGSILVPKVGVEPTPQLPGNGSGV
jgi:hypothetical protein